MEFKERDKRQAGLETIQLVCQLYKVTSGKDGGSRIVLDCGVESLEAIQKIQRLNAQGDTNLAVAIVPYSGE